MMDNKEKIKIYLLIIFNFLAFLSFASEVNVKIITYDSLNYNRLNGHYVYINDQKFVYSGDSSHCSEFTLDCKQTEPYYINIAKPNYHNKVILLDLRDRCIDTVIIIKMLYNFHPRILPVFFFEKYEYKLDSLGLHNKLEELVEFIDSSEGLIFTVEGYCDIDEQEEDCIDLALERSEYIRKLLIRRGVDSNTVESKRIGYKPYVIHYKEDIEGPFSFRDTLSQSYILNLSNQYIMQAQRYNRRVEISLRSKEW